MKHDNLLHQTGYKVGRRVSYGCASLTDAACIARISKVIRANSLDAFISARI